MLFILLLLLLLTSLAFFVLGSTIPAKQQIGEVDLVVNFDVMKSALRSGEIREPFFGAWVCIICLEPHRMLNNTILLPHYHSSLLISQYNVMGVRVRLYLLFLVHLNAHKLKLTLPLQEENEMDV